jgi:TrpR family trp operon transcriptional repressor
MCDLSQGKSQRSIAAEHGISLCKITRGAKILQREGAVTPKLIEKIYGGSNE